MTDYDIDIRGIDPEYKHTIDRTANRTVEDGREVHLSKFTVTVKVQKDAGDRNARTYAISFNVDHDAEQVRLSHVADAHSSRKTFGVSKLTTAIEYAMRAAVGFTEDAGPAYNIVGFADQLDTKGEHGDDVIVHTALEVAADA